ncbi:MAG: deoxyhypusine synthase family protein [Caldilineaceae bacterium]
MEHANSIKAFIKHHYRHFNGAALVDAAEGYRRFIADGGQMFLAMAGAMSTAELGLSLAEMIRAGKVHAISCTGANLGGRRLQSGGPRPLRAHPQLPRLDARGRARAAGRHLNRVTDTCIPEEEAIRRIEDAILDEWTAADASGERYFPHEFLYRILLSGRLEEFYQIDPKDSWLLAAAERNLPIFVPGWEDSTTGNIYASHCLKGNIRNVHTVRSGIEYMTALAEWYGAQVQETPIGFFQIGGGIAGDFPICVVPMLRQDMERDDIPLWAYFCQISDSTTSYGSYSGAVPNEKITWEKLDITTPRFIVESGRDDCRAADLCVRAGGLIFDRSIREGCPKALRFVLFLRRFGRPQDAPKITRGGYGCVQFVHTRSGT